MAVHLAKGTRDYLPIDMKQRLYLVGRVREVFERFGFEPLETPAFERIDVLLGKYGDETDKLTFKILKRGEGGLTGECDLALRYDLTVPLARFVAMHPELRMPFKRYQIQPVWRAEKPQRGRFREFLQCDVDTLGTTSVVADAECLAVVSEAMAALGIEQYALRVNDRRILSDLARTAGARDPAEELTVLIAVDKLDKVGRQGVEDELRARLPALGDLDPLFAAFTGDDDTASTLGHLQGLVGERGRIAIDNLRALLDHADAMGASMSRVRIDPSLARGADYYTGPVFEANVDQVPGSVAGGGRYDGLVGMFSSNPVPAVGISLGMDRLIVALAELGLLPEEGPTARVLVTVLSDETQAASAAAARALRAAGVATELYVGTGRFKAQLKHANARGYAWAAIVGPDEAAAGMVTVKHFASREQFTCTAAEAAAKIQSR